MIQLGAKIRKEIGKKTRKQQDSIPAVLYGPEIKNTVISIKSGDFKKVFSQTGESSLISLNVDIGGKEKEFLVLIHEIKKDPLSGEPIHIDFYQPILTKEVEAVVPLVFEGESLAVKEQGGTLVKEIQEIKVKALPQKLPHQIKIDISKLKTFEDEIYIKDLNLPEGVRVLKEENEIIAKAVRPQKVEEELAKPIEEKVEEVKEAVVKEEKPKEEAGTEPKEKETQKSTKAQ